MRAALLFGIIIFYSLNQIAQNKPSYDAHEWGTFTTLCGSDGVRLSGLFVDEEALPREVYGLSYVYLHSITPQWGPGDSKGWCPCKNYRDLSLENVNVKMETPVIYFYTDELKEGEDLFVNTKVLFPRGTIGQFYPWRVDGEIVDINYGNSSAAVTSIDFSQDYGGWCEWNTFITPEISSPNLSIETESHVWKAPRETESNVINTRIYNYSGIRNEYEKFIFYRGFGNFEIPVHLKFTHLNMLHVQNVAQMNIPFYIVYQRFEDGNAKVWDLGHLNGYEEKKLLLDDSENYEESMQAFEDALVEAGLYPDEAKAMLSTWKHSYFEVPGMKIFWVLPRDLTDEILPISFAPSPKNLERVMVGRSEILTPQFEEEMARNINSNEDPNIYKTDRYYYAYQERAQQIRDSGYNSTLTYFEEPENFIDFYPTLTSDKVNFLVSPAIRDRIYLKVFDIMGNLRAEKSIQNELTGEIDVSNYLSGVYIIQVKKNEKVFNQRFVKN